MNSTQPMPTGTVTGMATANLTVSLDSRVIEMAKSQAKAAGMKPSAWVAKLIREASTRESARIYDSEYNRHAAAEMADLDQAIADEQADRLAGAEW